MYVELSEDFFETCRYLLILKALILVGIVIVKEMDWEQVNDLVQTADFRNQKLVQDIHSLASSGTLSDFKFIVEGRELEVHKAILAGELKNMRFRMNWFLFEYFFFQLLIIAARSPVFERMFLGSFREATATELEVKDVSADTFEEFLYFIYAGTLRNKEFPIEELITVADRYEVLDLIKFCELKLIKNVNDDNAEKIFSLAQKIHLPNSELKKIAFEMLQTWVEKLKIYEQNMFFVQTWTFYRKFKRWSISMPDKFMNSPEKVFYSLDLKKKLEDIFAVDSETEEASDENNDEYQLTESIPTLSSGDTSTAQSIFSLPYSIQSVVTDSIQSIDEDISILLQHQ